MYYNISYTGTPPDRQRFSLRTSDTSVIISIKYNFANAYAVHDYSGSLIPGNAWDTKLGFPAFLKGDFGGQCGENRYLGVINILEVYLSPFCNFTIVPIDSIQTSVRLNWTMA